jgi:Bacterial SH3 domain
MLKKHLITGLFIVMQALGLNAQSSRFKENETLNVWAASGLNMRDKPDAKSAKIATIPYGVKVTVQPNIGIKIPFEVEEFKGFTVKGYWLLVKYGDTEGFVFDGFLSKLPAPIKNDSTTLEDYFDNQIGKLGGKYEVRFRDDAVDSVRYAKPNEKYDLSQRDEVSFNQKYKRGIISKHWTGEGGGGFSLEIPNVSLYEGYMLVKIFSYNDNRPFEYLKKENMVKRGNLGDDNITYTEIIIKNGKIIISQSAHC